MANNRIWLLCSVCNPEGLLGGHPGALAIAKEYPSSGWSTQAHVGAMMQEWFDEHDHSDVDADGRFITATTEGR